MSQPPLPTPSHNWLEVEASLAQLSGQTLGRITTPGPTAPLSMDSPVCKLMRGHSEAAQRCVAQCDQAVHDTLQSGRGQLFQCHAKLTVFTTRVAPRDTPISPTVLLGGKVFQSYQEVDQFRAYANELGIKAEHIEALTPDIRLTHLDDIKRLMEHSHAIASSVSLLEASNDQAGDQSHRLRYLYEMTSELESDPSLPVVQAALHGLGVLFRVGTSLLLQRHRVDPVWQVSDSLQGTKELMSDDELRELTIDGDAGWIEAVKGCRGGVHSDISYDLIQAGFPTHTNSVDLFELPGVEPPTMIALLDAHLTDTDRMAICSFCRHVGVLLERNALAEEVGSEQTSPEGAGLLWESDDPETLAQAILDKAITTVGADQGSVMLLDPEEDRLRIRAIHGIHVKYVEYVRIRRGEGISGSVLASGEPWLVEDISKEPHISQFQRSRYKGKSFISIPIRMSNRALGVINVTDRRKGDPFSAHDLRRLETVAQKAALAIDRVDVLRKTEELRKASMTDYLTSLLNRAAFDKRLREEVERAQRYPYANPLSLLVVDIDDFKQVNDRYGFFTGDDCIKACARTLQAGTRNIDSVYRRGGEEFTVLLPHTSREAALTLAERLCRAVETLQVVTKHTPDPVSFTISIGLATFPDDADTEDSLFKRCNQALHFAKHNGKNQVVTLPPNVAV